MGVNDWTIYCHLAQSEMKYVFVII